MAPFYASFVGCVKHFSAFDPGGVWFLHKKTIAPVSRAQDWLK
jgi:hypothetical protein